jgi:virulence-associated protein VapD
MAEARRYKAINFDLDTGRLIKEFGKTGRRKAYAQIQRFLTRNGFDHRQWSGYITAERRVYADIYVIIDALIACCPWLPHCTNRFDVTDFMAQSDALDYIKSKLIGISISEQETLEL